MMFKDPDGSGSAWYLGTCSGRGSLYCMATLEDMGADVVGSLEINGLGSVGIGDLIGCTVEGRLINIVGVGGLLDGTTAGSLIDSGGVGNCLLSNDV